MNSLAVSVTDCSSRKLLVGADHDRQSLQPCQISPLGRPIKRVAAGPLVFSAEFWVGAYELLRFKHDFFWR